MTRRRRPGRGSRSFSPAATPARHADALCTLPDNKHDAPPYASPIAAGVVDPLVDPPPWLRTLSAQHADGTLYTAPIFYAADPTTPARRVAHGLALFWSALAWYLTQPIPRSHALMVRP